MNRTHTKILSGIVAAAAIAALSAASLASAASGGPTVVLSSSASSTNGLASIPITATFSEDVSGFASTSILATNGTIGDFSGASSTYTFSLMPSAAGTTTVMVPADVASSTASSTGNQASNTLTFLSTMGATSTPTSTAPAISNVIATPNGTSSATIAWTTDASTTAGAVNYGTTSSYGATANETATSTTSHSVMLSGLQEATLYHFDVSSTNAGGTSTSTDMTFTTNSTASSTPLAVDGVTSVQSTATADNTFADGWQWVIHFTAPTNENALRIRFSDWGNASTSFPTANDVMLYSPQSGNASSSASGIVETDNGYGGWIYLDGDSATSTAGTQFDLYVNVKVPFGTQPGSYTSNFTAQTYPSAATSTATST